MDKIQLGDTVSFTYCGNKYEGKITSFDMSCSYIDFPTPVEILGRPRDGVALWGKEIKSMRIVAKREVFIPAQCHNGLHHL